MPEEHNRILTDRLGQALFCPPPPTVENLAREGIREGVHQRGVVMPDVATLGGPLAREPSTALADHQLEPDDHLLLAARREANAPLDPLARIAASFRETPERVPGGRGLPW